MCDPNLANRTFRGTHGETYYPSLLFSVAIIAAAISHQSLGSLGEFAGRVRVGNFASREAGIPACDLAPTRVVAFFAARCARFRPRKLPINKMHASIASVRISSLRSKTGPHAGAFYGARNFLSAAVSRGVFLFRAPRRVTVGSPSLDTHRAARTERQPSSSSLPFSPDRRTHSRKCAPRGTGTFRRPGALPRVQTACK